MRVVFELDLWDDPESTRVDLRCGSFEDFERLCRKHPPGEGDSGRVSRPRERGGTMTYFATTVWTETGQRVRLTLWPPTTEADYA